MQHHYIQNLQKANLFLKQKLKEYEDLDVIIKTAGVNAVTGGMTGLMDGDFVSGLAGMYH